MSGGNLATRWNPSEHDVESPLRHPRRPALFFFLKRVFSEWTADAAPRLGAALAFYTLFSLAPTLIIVISVAGTVFGQAAVTGRIFIRISGVLGPQAAQSIQQLLGSVYRSGAGTLASVIGAVTLLIAATGAFVELQDALNTIWKVVQDRWTNAVRERVISFLILLAIGMLILLSMIAGVALSAISQFIAGPTALWQFVDWGVSFGTSVLLFALMYKYVPDITISWKDTWVGALVTALLFSLGRFLIALYLSHTHVASTYGGAGAFIVVLVWVYYSSQIVFLGAEFTRVYVLTYGSGYMPCRGARIVPRRPPE
jgi:membrane protein